MRTLWYKFSQQYSQDQSYKHESGNVDENDGDEKEKIIKIMVYRR